MTTDPMGELRQADRVLRNAVDAIWKAASAAFASMKAENTIDPTAEHHPFDPALPGHLDAFIAAWQTDIGSEPTFPLATVLARFETNEWCTLTLGELIQLRDRLAFAEKTRLELAEKCAAYRGERDQARELAREAIDHLERQVGNEDDPCDFDHHGSCQTHFKDGSEHGKCGTTEARTFLAALPDPIPAWIDDSTSSPNSSSAAVEVTYGHQTYVFSDVDRIECRAELPAYALERACVDGVLTIVPGCFSRPVTQAELDQIHGDAAQREEEADIMRSAGAYDPDYGKDLDED